jgi:hypothetical protein
MGKNSTAGVFSEDDLQTAERLKKGVVANCIVMVHRRSPQRSTAASERLTSRELVNTL